VSSITVPTSARGRSGAISTSHYLATEAGADALRMGGNAIDAAIAAAAALCVVYPNNVALGGDLVAIVRDPSGGVRFVNATGRAASGERIEDLRRRHGDALPDRGIDTVTVPGGVRGWLALAGLGARLDWTDLLTAAARLAGDGAPVARSMSRALLLERETLAADPGSRDVFMPTGTPLGEGDVLRQPALADTLERLIAGGPDEFYVGEVARRWIDGLRSRGSRISAEDVAGYAPTVEAPISAKTLGVDVLTSPPNTQGFSLLRTLRAIEAERLADPLGGDAGRLADIFAANNRIRSRWLADPDVAPLDAEAMIGMAPPQTMAEDARVAAGDTVGLVAVSDDGWSVSLVQSVFWAFGAAVLEPSTGILFQNRGTSFSLDPGHPAAFAPGRRPPHTLMPVLVLRDGEIAFAAATMGGQAQAQIHAHLLLRLLDGASALEATSAPRWVVGAQDEGDSATTLTVEADVPTVARLALEGDDRELKLVPPRDERLGHSNLIRVHASGLDAASDPRSDGTAIVVQAGKGMKSERG
jgi:gamma-glutamyltranspeptidase